MKVRKILALGLIFMLVAALLVGCSKQEQPAQQQQQGQQEQGKEKIKVGLVFDVGGRGDLSFNDSAYAGLEKAKKDFGDKIEVEYREPSGGGQDREQLLRLLAENGFDLIFGVGFLFTDHIQKVAQEFPDVKFALIDGAIDGLDENSNVTCLLFKEHEGSFLVGAAAAMKSKTGKIGFVGGMKTPLIERFEAGYMAGAKYVNPNIEILSDYIGTTSEAFKDPVRGKELALKQFKDGADVIYHASGASGIGVIEAATAEKKFAIGVDSDQSLTAKEDQRPYILTSMVKSVDVAVYETIKALIEGNFKGGYSIFGLAENGVSYAVNDYNKELISDIQPKLDEIKDKIIKGEIKVPVDKKEYNEYLKSYFK
ncbi:BMP family lipoprotein [Thermosediminibacter oceani]|uniref:Nucleoside-binding protein n=1 Tax=Thermosediminibacter oceani (strain ATCC BAA-1034 / DSM 16646 / JW/IW-1228P) TaxID=555079 RepID=D9S1T3_THEOJ|nr:BMP family ABC transporter substrate-binding protein [Thermosediminibacter oceani]ADL07360.1 nucleoside-binding protein [Thermosediminibacter oceani DSM 16646]